jgi:hypothetical protein
MCFDTVAPKQVFFGLAMLKTGMSFAMTSEASRDLGLLTARASFSLPLAPSKSGKLEVLFLHIIVFKLMSRDWNVFEKAVRSSPTGTTRFVAGAR